jgi:hypothetical protein
MIGKLRGYVLHNLNEEHSLFIMYWQDILVIKAKLI